jgi:hypothetical protein
MAWATFWAIFGGRWAIFSQKHLVTLLFGVPSLEETQEACVGQAGILIVKSFNIAS